MGLHRRQLLLMTARAAGTMILSACGSGQVRPPDATSTSAPAPTALPPTALPSPALTSDSVTVPPFPAPAATGTPRPVPAIIPAATPTAQSTPPRVDFQPARGPIPASYFGMHIHQAATTTPWPAVPFGAWRLWDAGVTWPELEKRNTNWDFRLLDQYVALAEQHKVEILLPLGLTPTWASARPTEASAPFKPGNLAPPKYIEDWRTYVSTVARRYKGRIRNYEVWNEPNLPEYFTGTLPEIVTLTQEASRILRDIDPGITIVGPSATERETGPAWLDAFLTAGGGNYLDVIAHHLYVFPSPPEVLTPFIGRVRQVMAKHGMSDRPLWNSELGWSLPKVFSSDAEAAGFLARAYLLNWAGGVNRCYWYAWDNQEWATLWLTAEDSTTLKPAAIAYGEIQKWLVGAQIASSAVDGANTYDFRVVRGGTYTAHIVWNPDREIPYTPPAAWGARRVRDLTGGCRAIAADTPVQIGPLPILLEQ